MRNTDSRTNPKQYVEDIYFAFLAIMLGAKAMGIDDGNLFYRVIFTTAILLPVIGTILVSIMCLFARMTIPSKILCIIIAGSCSALCYLLILILMRHEIAESTIIPILKKIIKKR
jgi:predicted neutral ceramidase superfamily lipid hydrolase